MTVTIDFNKGFSSIVEPSSSEQKEGNYSLPSVKPKTKKRQISPASRWCFSWFNFPKDWDSSNSPIFKYLPNPEKDLIFCGFEICPTTGRPHLQTYVEFHPKKRPLSTRFPTGINWIKCKGKRQHNLDYCSKDGRFISNFPEHNKFIEEIDVFYKWELKIIEMLKEKPDRHKIYSYWSAAGRQGKTTFCKWLYTHYAGIVVLSGAASDMKNCIVDYKEKHRRTPKIIILNYPYCTNMNRISYNGIEEIKDMFFYSGKYKGDNICDERPHVLMFSNKPPLIDKMSSNRWVIEDIEEKE